MGGAILSLVVLVFAVWFFGGQARKLVQGLREPPFRVEEFWHGAAGTFPDGDGFVAIERELGERFPLSFRCDGRGDFFLILLVADSSPDLVQFTDGILRFVTDRGTELGGTARLVRVDERYLGLVYENGTEIPALLTELEKSNAYFDVFASCALWDGEHRFGVGATGLRPHLSNLLAVSQQKKEYLAELDALDDSKIVRN